MQNEKRGGIGGPALAKASVSHPTVGSPRGANLPLLLKRPLSHAALLAVALLGCLIFVPPAAVNGKEIPEPPFRQRIHAPPLPEGLTWLNTAGPLELADLRGKFVLVDFWTICCINCMHILPELATLEHA